MPIFMEHERNYFIFTPLLASTCVGTLEYRCITESIQSAHPEIAFHQTKCSAIDFTKQELKLADGARVSYTTLVLAFGARSNTFGIPGVNEYTHPLKDIRDARSIRSSLLNCLQRANIAVDPHQQRALLHFVIVGGGPTGVEFAAELHDFLHEDVIKFYPKLVPLVRITIFDVASRILGAFDERLAEYAKKVFTREGITVRTGTRVKSVAKSSIIVEDPQQQSETVETGLIIWSTGLTSTELAHLLPLEKDPHNHRLLTNQYLQIPSHTNVYAIGDCSIIIGNPLPCTAQVAKQQAQYLTVSFNNKEGAVVTNNPFIYRPMGMMAYLGEWRAIADLRNHKGISGRAAWLVWRSVYFSMAVSLKNKILIPIYWLLTWLFGRDITNL